MNNHGITPEMLKAKVSELAASNPSASYEGESSNGSCSYSKGSAAGKKGCIFGQAFSELGIPTEEIEKFDELDESDISSVLNFLDIESNQWFKDVQILQDCGHYWDEIIPASL